MHKQVYVELRDNEIDSVGEMKNNNRQWKFNGTNRKVFQSKLTLT